MVVKTAIRFIRKNNRVIPVKISAKKSKKRIKLLEDRFDKLEELTTRQSKIKNTSQFKKDRLTEMHMKSAKDLRKARDILKVRGGRDIVDIDEINRVAFKSHRIKKD